MTRISYGEHHGTISYMVGYEVQTFTGWVRLSMMDSRTVIARRYRGRNTWRLTSTDQVLGFTPHTGGRKEVAA